MKVLLVSIAFPPKCDPESIQVARYVRYMKGCGVDLGVVTSANPTLFMETDKALERYSDGIRVIKEISIFEKKYLNFLIRKIDSALLHYPDSKFTFWWQHKSIVKAITWRIIGTIDIC